MDLFQDTKEGFSRTKRGTMIWPENPFQQALDLEHKDCWEMVSRTLYLQYAEFDYRAYSALPDQVVNEMAGENKGWVIIYMRGGKTEFLRRYREQIENTAALCGQP